eukprot:3939201-Rhodomonas_salina.3
MNDLSSGGSAPAICFRERREQPGAARDRPRRGICERRRPRGRRKIRVDGETRERHRNRTTHCPTEREESNTTTHCPVWYSRRALTARRASGL